MERFVKHYAHYHQHHSSRKRHAHPQTLCQRWKSLNLFHFFPSSSFSSFHLHWVWARLSLFGWVAWSICRAHAILFHRQCVFYCFLHMINCILCVCGGVLRWRMVVILAGRYISVANDCYVYCSLAFRIALNSLLHFELLTTSISSLPQSLHCHCRSRYHTNIILSSLPPLLMIPMLLLLHFGLGHTSKCS